MPIAAPDNDAEFRVFLEFNERRNGFVIFGVSMGELWAT
jgi:hypothetical protein